jgi:hypothetical protein
LVLHAGRLVDAGQHGWFTPPQAQVLDDPLLMHDSEELHVVPLQQAWPAPPHPQTSLVQVRFAPQYVPPQHAWPCPPHGWHDPLTHWWPTPQAGLHPPSELASAPPDELLLPLPDEEPLEELPLLLPLEELEPLLLEEALLPDEELEPLLEEALLPDEELEPLLLEEALLPDEELDPLDEPEPLDAVVLSSPASPPEDPLAPDDAPPEVVPPDVLAVPEDPLAPEDVPAPDDPLVLDVTPLDVPEEPPPLERPSSVASAPFRFPPLEVELPPQAAASVDASQTAAPRDRNLRTFVDRVAPLAVFTASPLKIWVLRANDVDPRIESPGPQYSLLHQTCHATRVSEPAPIAKATTFFVR